MQVIKRDCKRFTLDPSVKRHIWSRPTANNATLKFRCISRNWNWRECHRHCWSGKFCQSRGCNVCVTTLLRALCTFSPRHNIVFCMLVEQEGFAPGKLLVLSGNFVLVATSSYYISHVQNDEKSKTTSWIIVRGRTGRVFVVPCYGLACIHTYFAACCSLCGLRNFLWDSRCRRGMFGLQVIFMEEGKWETLHLK